MAKALLGYVGVGSDAVLAAEVRRLRARVHELEDEIERLRTMNEAISVGEELLALDAEPALT